MNWKRGFRRITFVVAVVAAIACAELSVVLVLVVQDDAHSSLMSKRYRYLDYYGFEGRKITFFPTNPTEGFLARYRAELEKKREELGKKSTLSSEQLFKEIPEIEVLWNLENSFWANLSKGGLVWLCIATGLMSGIIGFITVWLIYKLLGWVVRGFAIPNQKTSKNNK